MACGASGSISAPPSNTIRCCTPRFGSSIAYGPAPPGGLLWDDVGHVTRPSLQSLHGLWRIWFDFGATQQYYPLLHTAFWFEHGLWGGSLLGYHLDRKSTRL